MKVLIHCKYNYFRLAKHCLPNLEFACNAACNAADLGLTPGLGRTPGEGNGNPLQYCCLENFMDRGAWLATVCGVANSQTGLSE